MVKRNEKRKTGTREWAEVSKNFCLGCKNDCLYCYSKANAIRFGQATRDSWKEMKVDRDKLMQKPKKVAGRIMFPTTHDITLDIIDETIDFLEGWLRHGNEILITSKPDPRCISVICDVFGETNYKPQITFRFTIGSMDDDVLKFWETNAPSWDDRIKALFVAHDAGFKTSVSCEPYFDDTIVDVVDFLLPYITDTIWIGKMNQVKTRLNTNCGAEMWKTEGRRIVRMLESQTDEKVKALYERFRANPKVKWKDSIKRVLGLPEEVSVG